MKTAASKALAVVERCLGPLAVLDQHLPELLDTMRDGMLQSLHRSFS